MNSQNRKRQHLDQPNEEKDGIRSIVGVCNNTIDNENEDEDGNEVKELKLELSALEVLGAMI